jgi:peptide/nickel transport system substrate-binding protein
MSSRTRKVVRLVAGLMAVGLLAASCGDSKSSSSSGGGATTTAANLTPVSGGTATVQLFSEIATLDPVKATGSGGSDGQRMFAVYGALLVLDQKQQMQYLLADSFKPSTPDFKTWVLTLKPGLKFTDGSPFDADAVKANWARTQDAANGSPSRGVSAFFSAMTVTSPTTLEITLLQANAHLDNAVERVGLNYIASKKAIDEKTDLTQKGIGAGPYKLDEWIRDSKMTLSKNPDWLGGKATVYLDKLILQVQSNEQQRVDSFGTGAADAFYTSVPGSVDAGLKNSGAYQTKVDVTTGQTFVMNNTKAPFDDLRVRKAIIMAINRDVLAKDILNNSVPAVYFSVPGTPWHSEGSKLPTYDVAGAQKLIDAYVADHGGQPVTFTMLAFQQTLDQDRAKFVLSQLGQLKNVKVDIQVNDSPTNIGKVLKGDYQWSSWGFPVVEPEPGLYNQAKTKSGFNYSGYTNPDVDKLLDAARVSTDNTLRYANYKKVFDQLAQDLPYFPYIVTTNSFVCSGKLQGCASYEDGILRFDLLWKKA